MRISDIFEAPITDFENIDTSDNPTSFTPSERKSLTSERGQLRYFNAFKKTPYNIKVTIVHNSKVDSSSGTDNENVDGWVSRMETGIHDEYSFYDSVGDKTVVVSGEAGVIKVVMLTNLSSPENRMPMTPWILAHKIGHSFQDQFRNIHHQNKEVNDFITTLDTLLHDLGTSVEKHHGVISRARDESDKWSKFMYPYFMTKILTMKIARVDAVRINPFEIFPEIIAQYLITGKVTLSDNYPKIKQIMEPKINKAVESLLNSIVGKVLVEV